MSSCDFLTPPNAGDNIQPQFGIAREKCLDKFKPLPFLQVYGAAQYPLRTFNRTRRKMQKLLPLMLIAAMLLSVCGCATIFKGTSSKVELSSEPAGAKVYVNGQLRGTTPVKLKLESKRTYHIEFKLDGHTTYAHTLTNHVGAGWIVLDVLFGLIPIIVDAASGSWYALDDESFNAILEPAP